MLLQRLAGVGVDFHQFDAVAPELGEVLQGAVALLFVEQHAVAHHMRDDQPPGTGQIGVGHLQIGVVGADVVMARQRATDAAIALLVVDRADESCGRTSRVADLEQPEIAHHLGAQVLQHEAVVAELRPRRFQRTEPIAVAGKIGEPLTVLRGRLLGDALDVAHHGVTERIRIEAVEVGLIEARLGDDGRMAVQELQHRAFGELAKLVHPVEDFVMHEGGAAFVHQLGLALGVEILRQHTDDAQEFALPVGELGGVLFEKIEQVFLGQAKRRALLRRAATAGLLGLGLRPRALGHRAPEIAERRFLILTALLQAFALLYQ